MTPDASTWRSSAQYDHLDELTASDLAWEWLRRNDDYDADFEASIADQGDPQPLTERIRQRWGLRFPCRSAGPATRCAGLLAPSGGHKCGGADRSPFGTWRQH